MNDAQFHLIKNIEFDKQIEKYQRRQIARKKYDDSGKGKKLLKKRKKIFFKISEDVEKLYEKTMLHFPLLKQKFEIARKQQKEYVKDYKERQKKRK